MSKDSSKTTTIIAERHFTLSVQEVCQSFGIEETWVRQVIEEGILSEPAAHHEPSIDAKDLQRLKTSIRLHQDLGVNVSGIALILDLLDEIEQLRSQLPSGS